MDARFVTRAKSIRPEAIGATKISCMKFRGSVENRSAFTNGYVFKIKFGDPGAEKHEVSREGVFNLRESHL
jgi:hypothetical protein